MTNQANEQANQSDELKELVDQVEKREAEPEMKPDRQMNEKTMGQDAMMEIDVLNLPPRKETHHSKRRPHIKISAPLIRLLIVILIILAVLGGLYYVRGTDMLSLLPFG